MNAESTQPSDFRVNVVHHNHQFNLIKLHKCELIVSTPTASEDNPSANEGSSKLRLSINQAKIVDQDLSGGNQLSKRPPQMIATDR